MTNLFSTKNAAQYLGVSYATLKRYIDREDCPIEGTLINPRNRVFTQSELDDFKQFMSTSEFNALTQPGRKPDDPVTKTIVDEDGNKRRVLLKKV